MPIADSLDDQIRALVTELMESVPQAPTISELDWREDRRPTTSVRTRTRARVRRGRVGVIGGLGASVTVLLLLVLVLPSVGQKPPVAAAAQLRLIADNAARQPIPQLTSQQWLEMQVRVSFTEQVTEIDSKPVTGAEASIPGTVTQWSNNFGESCWTTVVGSAAFVSPANKRAWDAIGLPDAPSQPTDGLCVGDAGANVANGQGGGVVNVAGLSTDPATLAHELQTGTTGVPAIDAAGPPSDTSNGLVRAAELLLGPTTGSSPTLTAAVYRALALMPDVSQLGSVTTHSGAAGLGFSSTSPYFGKRAIIVNPSTGQLLELQNIAGMIPYEAMSTGITRAYPEPEANPGSTVGGNGNVDWIDPVGDPMVVASVPSDLAGKLPPLTAQVTATEASGTYQSTSFLQSQLDSEFDHDFGGGPSLFDGAVVLYLDFDGQPSQVPAFVAAIRASGLFQSVVVTYGPN
jgi:hypothetical protein